jgi:hypothetical protein
MTYKEQYDKIRRNFDTEQWDTFARKLLTCANYKNLITEYDEQLNINAKEKFAQKLCEKLQEFKLCVLKLNNNVFKEELFIYCWNDVYLEYLQNYVHKDCEDNFFSEEHVQKLKKGLVCAEYVLTKKDAQFYIDLRRKNLVKFIK